MHRISTDIEYLQSGKVIIDADGIPLDVPDRSAMTAADTALGQRIDAEKWARGPVSSSVTHADNLTTPGIHNLHATLDGLPFTGIGSVEVIETGTGITQRATSWSLLKTWLRRTSGGVFGAWEPIPTSSDVTNAVKDKADKAYADSAAAAAKWNKSSLTTGVSVDTLIGSTAVGIHPVGSSAPGLPVAGAGWVTVTHDPFSGSTTQTFRAASPTIKGSWSRQHWGGAWRTWSPLEWSGSELRSGTDLNTITTPGTYGIATTGLTNSPAGAGIGTLEVLPFGNAVIQRYTDRDTRMWTRYVGVSQTEWQEHPTVDQVENMLAGITPTTTVSGGLTSGMKLVPLSITLPGTTVTQEKTEGSVRWVRRWAHAPSRIRVHIMNRNPANQSDGGEVTITGANVGVGAEAGDQAGRIQLRQVAFTDATIPAGGGELVSDWLEFPGQDGDALGLTLGWRSTGTQQVLQGGGWVSETAASWADALPAAGWSWSQTTPFYVWVEAEVPASAPVLIVSGDSVSIGTAADDPVSDSWPAFYGLDQNALPVYFCQHGSTLTNWAPTSARWANMFPGMTVQGDALVVRLGSNDIVSTSVDFPELKTRYAAVREAHAQQFPGVPVCIGGMTPSTRPPEREIVRREFDEWLSTLPHGERDWFDFRSALAAPDDETLIPEYSADGTHPSTAGQRRMADVVLERPVTPYVATQAQLRKLAAL